MTQSALTNLRITDSERCDPPEMVKEELPVSPEFQVHVAQYREQLVNIITGKDPRMLVIAGPCSIRDEASAYEVGRRIDLAGFHVRKEAFVMMRACFEKPRTISSPKNWTGLILDPDLKLNGSHDFNKGIRLARKIAITLLELGIPLATEILDSDIAQYFDDIWVGGWIGARTVSSPELRRAASGMSFPMGFKNPPDGRKVTAMEAAISASHPSAFKGPHPKTGQMTYFDTTGNPHGFIILRGADTGPNYDETNVREILGVVTARNMVEHLNLPEFVLTDCSHGNTLVGEEEKVKDYTRQSLVFREARRQHQAGLRVGAMLEVNLEAGAQKIFNGDSRNELVPGKSITDACIGIDTFEGLMQEAFTDERVERMKAANSA